MLKSTSLLYIAQHAEELFRANRWAAGLVCPYCGSVHIYHYKNGSYRCAHCHKTFTDKTGTIFQYSKLSLSQLYLIIYLLLSGKGMSSIEIANKIGITQKAAYLNCQKIRWAFDQDSIQLEGEVAMDEVYLNGSWTNFPMYKKIRLLQRYGLWQTYKKDNFSKEKMRKVVNQYKQPVYGLNDGKNIVLRALPNDFAASCLSDIFTKQVVQGSLAVSDQSLLYNQWKQRTGSVIETNNHSKLQFKTKNGHTSNRIEGTFSNLKRQNLCTYVHFQKKHSQLYLNDFVFRWNHRHQPINDKLAAAFTNFNKVVTYKQVLAYDERTNYAVIKHKMSFADMLHIFEYGIVASLCVNGIEYNVEDVRAALEQRLVYPI